MRLPVVPVVVVTEVDSMGVPVVVVTEPPADEPCVGPVSPKFLFQVCSNFYSFSTTSQRLVKTNKTSQDIVLWTFCQTF